MTLGLWWVWKHGRKIAALVQSMVYNCDKGVYSLLVVDHVRSIKRLEGEFFSCAGILSMGTLVRCVRISPADMYASFDIIFYPQLHVMPPVKKHLLFLRCHPSPGCPLLSVWFDTSISPLEPRFLGKRLLAIFWPTFQCSSCWGGKMSYLVASLWGL